MTAPEDIEFLTDVTGLPSQQKVTEIVTAIAAGVVIVIYSASELLEEIQRWKSQRSVLKR